MKTQIKKNLLVCINCEELISCDYKIKSCLICEYGNHLTCDGIKILDNNQEIELTLCSQCYLTLRWSIFSKQYSGKTKDGGRNEKRN